MNKCLKGLSLEVGNIKCKYCNNLQTNLCCICGKRKVYCLFWEGIGGIGIIEIYGSKRYHKNYFKNIDKLDGKWGKKICKTCFTINKLCE